MDQYGQPRLVMVNKTQKEMKQLENDRISRGRGSHNDFMNEGGCGNILHIEKVQIEKKNILVMVMADYWYKRSLIIWQMVMAVVLH